ncbi:hypoxia induced protein conserved region-domain-containing protein [Xylariales sp. AK1849]|nr:hypoxia induced protein conserved region-domain-containing protein [Xylariales sp. AK1849]
MADRSMPSSFDEDKEYNETGFAKVSRKLREEPLVPLGTALTCFALYNAWRAMRRGDHAQVQRMFRARIGAQAFTVFAMVAGGAYYGQDRQKRKELIKLEAEQRAEDRHQKWLRELEVRDEEEKQLKEHLKRRKERVQAKRTEDVEQATAAGEGGPTAETTPDVEGPVPLQESKMRSSKEGSRKEGSSKEDSSKEGSSVLGALSGAGGWFGTGKSNPSKSVEEQKVDDAKRVTVEATKK